MWETDNYRHVEMQHDLAAERLRRAARQAALERTVKAARAAHEPSAVSDGRVTFDSKRPWARVKHPVARFARLLAGLF